MTILLGHHRLAHWLEQILVEDGNFDNDLLEDSAMFIVDDVIDDNLKEAEDDIFYGESLTDSDMIDLIDDGEY